MDDRNASNASDHYGAGQHDADDGFGSPARMYRDMLADLNEEILASDEQRPMLAGVVSAELPAQPPYFRYAVSMEGPLPPFRAEAYVKVLCNGTSVMRGQVETAADTRLVLATLEPLPRSAWAEVLVVPDDRWLLERLRDAIAERRAQFERGETPDEFDHHMAKRAIGRTLYDRNDAPEPSVPPATLASILDPLNESQQDAVVRAVHSRNCILSGPPGTGKTRTVAAAVEVHVRAGRRVLVMAPSNPATDVLTMALAHRLRALDGFDDGRILLRVGPRPMKTVRDQLGDCVIPARVASRLISAAYEAGRTRVEGDLQDADALLAKVPSASERATRVNRRRKLHVLEADALARGAAAGTAALVSRLLDEARVVVTPIQNVYLSPTLLGGPFDVVVVDECSMVTLPQLCLAAGKARISVLTAGDHMQLPAPIAQRRGTYVRQLPADVFEAAHVMDAVVHEESLRHLALLTIQHRMATPICELVSRTFYRNRLTSAPEVRQRPAVLWPWRRASVLLVDTSALEPFVERPVGSRSRLNRVHLSVMQRILESLAESEPQAPDHSLLLLSAFTAQVEGMKRELRAPPSLDPYLSVSSVHRAQGQEARSVILSIDDAEGAPISRFFGASELHEPGSRLLNVALSRARDRLLILASASFLSDEGGRVVRQLVHDLQGDGSVIPVEDVVPIDDILRGSLRAPTRSRRRQAASRTRADGGRHE
jgi:hypothetical protein